MAQRPIGPSLISPPPGSDANLPDWQSEHLSTAFVAVLAIFLRQLGSLEYTPVVATSRPDRRRGGPRHPSERQRVRCRRTRSGVVENDPALGPDFARRHHPLKDGLEPIGSIGRAIHVRTAVQAKIDLALGAAGKACTRGRLRIGRNRRDPPRGEPMIRRGREPGIVPRLQHDRRVDLGPTSVQKSACPGLVKGQAGGVWIRTGPRRSPSPRRSAARSASRSSQFSSLRRCVISRGALTAKRKSAGVAAAQRSKVETR